MKGFTYTERLIIKLIALIFLTAAAFSAELLSVFGIISVMIVLLLGISSVSGQLNALDRSPMIIFRDLIFTCMKGRKIKRSRKVADRQLTFYHRNAS